MSQKGASSQIEFVDLRRHGRRPPGSGEVIDGFFVFNATPQTLAHVAYTLQCSVTTVMRHIEEGEFLGAIDISQDKSKRACYRVPREDVLEFIQNRREGAWNHE
jgi:hypothetical protein